MSPYQGHQATTELLSAGTAVMHYVIKELIDSGAAAVVYLAEDKDLDRRVALKFLSPDLSQDKGWRDRFRREAQAVAQLNHPHIVTIYEVGEFGGQPFIAMEYVEGGSLDSYIEKRRLKVEEALELAIQISDGLAEAHGRGIVHRDIKPSNILVSERGRAPRPGRR